MFGGLFKKLTEAKATYANVGDMQVELQGKFATLGMDFGSLHPTIHGAVLLEAMAFGVANAFAHFESFSVYIGEGGGSEDEKAQRLIDLYEERSNVLKEMNLDAKRLH